MSIDRRDERPPDEDRILDRDIFIGAYTPESREGRPFNRRQIAKRISRELERLVELLDNPRRIIEDRVELSESEAMTLVVINVIGANKKHATCVIGIKNREAREEELF